MPQPNETERGLIELLQAERQRNGSATQATLPPALPEIDISMFLSPSGQRELEAMQSLRPLTGAVPAVPILNIVSATPSVEIAEFSTNWEITAEDFEAAARVTAAEPTLERLFMERAEREIGSRMDAEAIRAIRLGQEQASVSEYDFNEPPMYRAPRATGGTIVSQRGPQGFASVPRTPTPRPVATASPQAPAAPSPPPKSRYERLLGKSIID